MTNTVPRGSMLERFRTTAIVWLAMLLSVVMYAFVVESIHRGWIDSGQPAETLNGDQIHLILLGLSVLSFFLAGAVKSVMLRGLDATTQGESVPAEAGRRLQGATIVAAAISESIAIMGLVEYMLIRRHGSFYLFAALALIGFMIHAPRVSQWMHHAGTGNSLES